jgi:hypothetical protein
MVDWTKWNAMAEIAKASPAGKVLTAAGYDPWHTGGGGAAWRKVLEDGTHVLIGDGDYGLGEDMTDPQTFVWGVGLYSADAGRYAEDEAIGLQAAITWCGAALANPAAVWS